MSSLNRQFGVVTTIVLAATWIGHTQDKKDDSPAALVLERGETIDFTTDEGTWMSLDVSPDGKTIAFDLLGDIYTLPIEGGAAKRIVGRDVVRKSAEILARREDHRIPQRPQWRGKLVACRRRRLESATGDEG